MRWIAITMLFFVGCASNRVKVSVTRLHGEPVVSVEFEAKEKPHYSYEKECHMKRE